MWKIVTWVVTNHVLASSARWSSDGHDWYNPLVSLRIRRYESKQLWLFSCASSYQLSNGNFQVLLLVWQSWQSIWIWNRIYAFSHHFIAKAVRVNHAMLQTQGKNMEFVVSCWFFCSGRLNFSATPWSNQLGKSAGRHWRSSKWMRPLFWHLAFN